MTFAVAAAGLPLLVHEATGAATIVAPALLAILFTAWSWRCSCAHARTVPSLAIAIGVGQLLVHVAYVGAAHAPAFAPEPALHVHHATAQAGPASLAAMVAVHLVAALLGASVLTSLDRRALQVVATVVGSALGTIAHWMRPRAASNRVRRSPRPLLASSPLHARARRLRLAARVDARRGPPQRATHSVTT
jgi:hypothetical protein